jgi:eukaryotic-like serine/threonine-protein kinase
MRDRVGQQLGNYQLTRLLGEGGFAEVYLGEHIHLGTQAAIKVMNAQLTSDDIDKFRTEARIVARLIHPHIVRVLDFGVEGKTPFLVMDYAPNGTLRHRHPRGVPLPIDSIVSYVKQIAEALQYAHDEKLIHRDIKPENMLLGRRNEALLSDFGIAIVAQSSRYQNAQDMAGTISYMAPEQIQAHPRPASDQYSLGIVVYEWLSGDRPFHGSFSEIAAKHSVATPPSLQEKVPTISPDVAQVVMTALAKEPKERFGSVQAFAHALEQASQSTQSSESTVIVKLPIPSSQPSPLAEIVVTPLPALIPPSLDALPKNNINTYRGHSGAVNAVVWSSDGKRIASGGVDQTVQVWNASTGRSIFTYRGHSARVNAISWSINEHYIVSGSDDQTAQIWDTFTNSKVFSCRVHSSWWVWVRTVAWSPDGALIATGCEDGTVQIWDAVTESMLFTYRNHTRTVTTLAWSPDSKSIVSGSADKTLQVWQAKTGSKLFTYNNHSSLIFSVAWSFDGKRIASGSNDKTVHLWDAITGSKIFTYRGHSGSVKTVAWSPDGQHIVSGSEDRTVQIWDASTGNKVFTYRGHSGSVNSIAWSPDGKYIASGSDDKTVQVWVAP